MFDLLKKLILPKVPHLNFEGLDDAQAKEMVMSRLLGRIKEAYEEMSGGDTDDAFSLPPPPNRAQ